MRKLLYLFGILFLSLLCSHAQAQCNTWDLVGAAGFTTSTTEGTSLAFDASDNLYIGYYNGFAGGKATVKKYAGGTWQTIGYTGFSAGEVQFVSMAIDPSGTPYIAYEDYGFGYRATVMKFTGGYWQVVGTPGFSAGQAQYTTLAIDGSGTPYIAYEDAANSDKATVMKFTGGSWQVVGTAGFSNGAAQYPCLALDGSGTPYVAYNDSILNKATVMKFSSGSWQLVGTAGFSAGEATFNSLAINSSGVPYLAYMDWNNGQRASVMDFVSGSWQQVGTAGFSASFSNYVSLAINSSGTPYVAYSDYSVNYGAATVMKFNGSVWDTVGYAGISGGVAQYTSMAVNSGGVPYVAFEDFSQGLQATVMRCGPYSASAAVVSNVTYTGGNDGKAVATPSGGLAPYTYSWDDGETNATATSLVAGTHTVTVSNNGGCSATASVTLTQSAQVVGPEATVTKNATCNGGANASAVSNPVGGTAPYTYAWQGGTTTSTISGLSAGTYTITVTDNSGNTGTASVTINQPAAVIPYIIVNSNVTVYNYSDGVAIAYVSGGTTPYTYSWDDGETTQLASHLNANTHTVTVTDSAGCSGTASFTIIQPGPQCNTWDLVGPAGFTTSTTEGTSLAFDASDNLYIGYYNGFAGGKATVKKYAGGTWQTIGYTGFSAGEVQFVSMAIDPSGTPYIAYEDYGFGYRATVMKFTGGYWQVVGTPGFSAGQAQYTTLAIDGSGTPYIAYEDAANSDKATVMKFTGGSWQVVGTAGFSNGAAQYPCLALDGSGTPYVAYNDSILNKATVMKFSSGSWQLVGTAGFSAGEATFNSLAINSSGVPYLAYMDWNNGQRASVMDFVSGSWQQVGTAGFSASFSNYVSLAINSSGTPYVAYSDYSVNYGAATVMKFNGSAWDTVGYAGISGGVAQYTSLAINSSGVPYVAFEDFSQGLQATVMRCGPYSASAAVVSNVTYTGGNDGKAVATPSGGLAPYTYSWDDGETNATATSLVAGTHTVTVSNNGGCSATASVTLTQSAQVVGPEATVTKNATCNGGANASAVSNPVGGTAPYTYAWQGGTTTSTISGLSAGTYTITVTDNSGNTGTASVTINQPAPVIAYIIVNSNVTVYNGSDGSAIAYVSGGTTPYTYHWDDGETTQLASHLNANTHTVTVSDSAGCSGTASLTITQPSPVCTGWWPVGNTGFSASYSEFNSITTDASGTPYMCYYDGSVSGKASVMKFNGTTWQLVGTAGFSAGQVLYTSIAIDGSGTPYVAFQDAFHSSGATVMKYSGGSWQVVGTTNLSSGQANFISLAIDGSGTPYVAYQDVNNSYAATVMKFSSGSWQPVGTVGFSAGEADYTTLAIDGSGTPYIAYVDFVNFRYCTVMNFSSGSWQPVGSAGFSPNQVQYPDITLSSTGTPYVVFSDANSGNQATVMEYNSGSWSIVGTEGFSHGFPYGESITIDNSGTPYISYIDLENYSGYVMKYSSGSWQTVGASAISPGETAYLTVKSDTSGNVYAGFEDYSSGRAATVERFGTFGASAALNSNITCYGNNNGNATAYPSGGTSPYTYLWDDGETSQTATTLSAGTHTVTIIDHQTCSATDTVTINEPAQLTESVVSSTNLTCFNVNTGSIALSASGGTTPYTYNWNPNVSNGATASNLSAGTYSINITDANGCSAILGPSVLQPTHLGLQVTITQPTQFQYVSAGVVSNETCYGGFNGSVTVNPVGGNPPYTYAWNNASTTVSGAQTATGLSAGTYTITVEDNCGASKTATATINQPAPLRDSISSVTNITCSGGNGGSVSVGVKGGTYPYLYTWAPGGSTLAMVSNLTAGSYTVIVTDQNGCSTTNTNQVATITQPAVIRDSVAGISYPLCYGQKGSITVGVKGGISPYVYSWTSALSTTSTATSVAAGSYTVTIKDAHRCAVQLVVTMTQPGAIRDSMVAAAKVNVSCNGGSDASATVGVKYGTSPYTYHWTPNVSSTATAGGLSAGVYSVTVTDKNGCLSATSSVTITQPMVLRDSAAVLLGVGCNGGNGGQISIGTRGGTAPYTYAWSNGKTTYTMSGLTAGTYTVTITDHGGCSNTLSETVTQPTVLTSAIPTPACTTSGHGTITISGSGGTPAYKFTWSNGSTSTSITVANGTYTVKETDAHGCSATNSVTMACPDALPQEKGNEPEQPPVCCGTLDNVNLYPNPNTGQFTITGLTQGMTVEMYDYTGRRISISTAPDITMRLNISEQPNGIYLMRAMDKDGNMVSQKKVVKTQ